MGKGKSGHKSNEAAQKNRARYKLEGRYAKNKARKARKEVNKLAKLKAKRA